MRWQPEFDPADDPGNPYQHLLDSDCDDCEDDIDMGLSVYGLDLGLRRPRQQRED